MENNTEISKCEKYYKCFNKRFESSCKIAKEMDEGDNSRNCDVPHLYDRVMYTTSIECVKKYKIEDFYTREFQNSLKKMYNSK